MSPLYVAAVIVAVGYLLVAKRLNAGSLFLLLCLTTEFWYVYVFDGVLRPYHLVAPFLLFFLMRETDKAFAAASIRGLVLFLTLNLIASLAVYDWGSALQSYMLFVANGLVAVALFGVMLRRLDRQAIAETVLAIGVLTVVLGLTQFVGSRAGIDVALSNTQTPFVASGEVAAFWTEPDQLGKFLTMPFLLALVWLVRGRKHAGKLLAFIGLGIALNFVRSAIYGLIPAVLVLGVIVARESRLRRLFGIILTLALLLFVFLILVNAGVIPLGAYPLQRLARIFDLSYTALATDGSGAYRLQSMRMLLDQTLASPESVVVGLGLNQASGSIGGTIVRLGGGDLLNLFGGSGVFGVVSYVLLVAPLLYVPLRQLRVDSTDWFAQWLLITAVAFLVTGQMSGMLIMPQFWVLIAANGFLDYTSKRAVKIHPVAVTPHGMRGQSAGAYE